MTSHTTEVVTGAAVLAVAVGFFLYAGQITGFSNRESVSHYWASFRAVEGVSIGTDVRVAGVKVGSVTGLELDPQTFRAKTEFSVKSRIALPEDTAVVIASEGLLGGTYVEILPGGSPFNLEPGAEIEDTQGSVSIINLLMKFVTGSGETQ